MMMTPFQDIHSYGQNGLPKTTSISQISQGPRMSGIGCGERTGRTALTQAHAVAGWGLGRPAFDGSRVALARLWPALWALEARQQSPTPTCH
jgi:hypothetical protein